MAEPSANFGTMAARSQCIQRYQHFRYQPNLFSTIHGGPQAASAVDIETRRFLVVLILLKVFHVLLRGGPLTWSADGSAQTVRFYRNETVLAESKAVAVEKARIRTWDRLRANPLEYAVNLDQFELEVDDITADFRFWTLVGRQGFVFYTDS